jgi:aminopeptidase N
LWSQGEEEDNHRWFPTYDAPNDKATWDMTVTVPSEFMVVSNGTLISDTPVAAKQHTVHWRQLRPSSTYLVSLIVSPLVTVRDSVKSGDRYVQLEYNVYAPDTALARRAFAPTAQALSLYERLTGVQYPWTRYAQTEVAEFPYGGMENVGATTLYDPMPDARAYLDHPYFVEQVVPHELAHQWFGDYVTTVDWVNEWLNEGFATFMNGQYLGAAFGKRAEQDFFLSQYLQYRQTDAKRRIAVTGLAEDILYNKGSSILEMLKLALGDTQFWAVIHDYLTTHSYGNVVTSDLSHSIQKVTGQNMDWFFDEWVYKAGHPEFVVTQSYDSTARRLTLTVAQTQTPRTDTLIDTYDEKIDPGHKFVDTTAYETPPVFRMPVSILVGTTKGDVTRRVQLNARQQTLTIDSLPGAPTFVSFDYVDGIVKTLQFNQPTPWLAALLAREVSPFQVLWAVEQLQARASDPEALKALTAATTQAHYALTRAQAASALARVQEPSAVSALQAAMRDTSAQVRQAALSALAAHSGEIALPVARAAFAADSSYRVQATAIYAIARLDTDSSERHTLVSRALSMPSYQHIVQTTALRAIAQMGDMSFIPELEQVLDRQQGVAQVLAALAKRGSTEAHNVLSRHLNDPRPLVKRWVTDAYGAGNTP